MTRESPQVIESDSVTRVTEFCHDSGFASHQVQDSRVIDVTNTKSKRLEIEYIPVYSITNRQYSEFEKPMNLKRYYLIDFMTGVTNQVMKSPDNLIFIEILW